MREVESWELRVESGKGKCLALLGLLLLVLGAEAKQPNVLLIIADQWRAESFGYAGNPDVKTPNIDRLARESINLRNAVASMPVCCPTRASLFTGQRAFTHGVFLNDVPLAPEANSLAKVMKAAGYDTGYIGKWHLNGDGRSAFIPKERRQGFDYWKVLECTHEYNDSFYYDGDNTNKLKWPGYDAIAQTADAQNYLRERSTNKAPFLFVLSWGPPHNPYTSAPEKYRAMYQPKQLTLRGNVPADKAAATRRDLAGYYAHCTALDDCMSNLLQTLRDTGLDQNTIVIFTADHGDMLGSHDQHRKQRPWDESIRIPLLIRWPAKFQPHALDTIFTSEDYMPTILGLCGIGIPKTVEGLDYSRYLIGGKNPSDGATLLSCMAPFGEFIRSGGGKEFRGIRTERFTYVRDLTGPWLLYDNVADPLQMTNLAKEVGSEKLQAELDRRLQRKLDQTHDQFLPGDDYVKKWGYKTDANGTVPYER